MPPAHRLPSTVVGPKDPRTRFREPDHYRVQREWLRYEGTPLRALFRTLRERFLRRHAASAVRTLEVGPGPGRFSALVGGAAARRTLLDLSDEMLRAARSRASEKVPASTLAVVRGDAVRVPFRKRSFDGVVVLGNTLGFAAGNALSALAELLELVGPGGRILVEIAPGAGERSRYLARLPAGAVGRLFRAPAPAIVPRITREGFAPLAIRRQEPGPFRRFSAVEVESVLRSAGFSIEETVAVAPALATDQARITAVHRDPVAWARALEVEEEVGRAPARWKVAAAVLIAARRTDRPPTESRESGPRDAPVR